MKLTTNFSLEELTHPDAAVRAGINNTPSPELMPNLKRMAEAMEEVRQLLDGQPITVSSGYRGPEVNKLIGGSLKPHMQGWRVTSSVAPSVHIPDSRGAGGGAQGLRPTIWKERGASWLGRRLQRREC